jgi:predicted DNA-binding transcriptional regulator AlpA
VPEVSTPDSSPHAILDRQPLVKLGELPAIIGVSARTLRGWIKKGQFPPPLAGRRWSAAVIKRWLAGQQEAAHAS